VDQLGAAWAALRAFFSEGMTALQRATEGFASSEGAVRSARDDSRLILWLLGTATALRYSRRPEPMETGLARARELVNVVGRLQDEVTTVPYRALVEGIYRDLAWVVPSQAGDYIARGLEYSDRSLRLARRAGGSEWAAQAYASRGDLLAERASDRRGRRTALTAHEEAQRRWPARDRYGWAQASIGYARTLLSVGEAFRAASVARETVPVFQARGDRYHEATARVVLAQALYAQDESDALDAQAAAAALFRALGCRWELARAEAALS
jgi:hypothetical protein